MKAIITDKKNVIVGLGKTGLSCVRYLHSQGKQITVMDTREAPPGLDELNKYYPNIRCYLGGLDQELLNCADEIFLSPGIALNTPEIKAASDKGVLIRGDIDLFSEVALAPIVAITGSNGKSTVTTLLGQMAQECGLKIGIGGNLGVPALDLLDDSIDLYVLELSSFQLETIHNLNAESVVLLNLSEDHMDRYPNKMAYLQAKQRIFKGAKNIVVNDDQLLSSPLVSTSMKLVHFGLETQDLEKFSLLTKDGSGYLVKGFESILAVSDLKIRGDHNISNALAALALGSSLGLKMSGMLKALKEFKGLEHRCQFVRSIEGVEYFNDSKGTNPGSVVTALNSLGKEISGRIVLIAGGEAKGADLSPLYQPVKKFVKALVLIGVDAGKFEALLQPVVSIYKESTMQNAVKKAKETAEVGDLVLLSPACASFDMFKNFEHRGEIFMGEVMSL
ncbi:MAG: UDP-N-acetylmuramoylalanine--D-glutamate ligase [Oleiphilaceae bacterium]|jgi:UDP-N-acetylmuramoylalanine--D-glutamate ligase